MIYYSKKDSWLVALVSSAVVIPLLIGLYQLFARQGDPQAGWSALLIGVTTGAVVVWLTYPLYYEITATALKIRCGMLIRQQIPLTSIAEVSQSRNPLSAPAWSLDRLRVSYRRGDKDGLVLISPEDKLGFMRELANSGMGLEMRGERVVRAA